MKRFPANCLAVALWARITTGAKMRRRGTHFYWVTTEGAFHFTAPGRRRGYLRNALYMGRIERMQRNSKDGGRAKA